MCVTQLAEEKALVSGNAEGRANVSGAADGSAAATRMVTSSEPSAFAPPRAGPTDGQRSRWLSLLPTERPPPSPRPPCSSALCA